MKHLKKFNESSITDEKYIQKETKVINDIKEITRKAYFNGLSQGLAQGSADGFGQSRGIIIGNIEISGGETKKSADQIMEILRLYETDIDYLVKSLW